MEHEATDGHTTPVNDGDRRPSPRLLKFIQLFNLQQV